MKFCDLSPFLWKWIVFDLCTLMCSNSAKFAFFSQIIYFVKHLPQCNKTRLIKLCNKIRLIKLCILTLQFGRKKKKFRGKLPPLPVTHQPSPQPPPPDDEEEEESGDDGDLDAYKLDSDVSFQ